MDHFAALVNYQSRFTISNQKIFKVKFILKYIILFALSPLVLSAQDMKLVQVESNEIINLTAEESWRIVQDWSSLNRLVPEIVESTSVDGAGLGSTWHIYLKSGGRITEKMVYYNSNDRTMSYIMTETPMPIQEYTAVLKVDSYGISKSMVSFYTSCSTSNENFEKISKSFKAFQETYLSNIINQKND